MIILNKCIDCGRVPKIGYGVFFCNAICSCGKVVSPLGNQNWTEEVAADMWNRANPVESALDVKGVYLNWLAGELARYKLRVIVTENGLTINETCPADKFKADNIDELLRVCRLHTQDLTEFYRKRLEPAV